MGEEQPKSSLVRAIRRTRKTKHCCCEVDCCEAASKPKKSCRKKLVELLNGCIDNTKPFRTIRVAFKIAHEVILSDQLDEHDCDWKIFLSEGDGYEIHHFIEKVAFHVQEPSSTSNSDVSLPPFQIKGSGKRGVLLKCIINIYLKNGDRVRLEYDAIMEPGSSSSNSMVENWHFHNQSEEFEDLLLKGGGTFTKSVDWTKLLPVELMERVFANLRPRDLILAGQVCRRWRDVAKSKAPWKRSHRHILVDEIDAEDKLVLKGAGSLGSLSLDSYMSPAPGLSCILLKSDIVLSELYLDHKEPWSWEANFLRKQSKHLKKLSIMTRTFSRNVLKVVAGMKLKELILEGAFNREEESFIFDPSPTSELKNIGVRYLPLQTTRSLVSAHKECLEYFRSRDDLDVDCFKALTECKKLKELEIKANINMHVLEEMPALKVLTVVVARGSTNFRVPVGLEELAWSGRYSHVQLCQMVKEAARVRVKELTFLGDAGCLADEYTQSVKYAHLYGKQSSSLKEMYVTRRFPQDVLCDILTVHRETFEGLECKDLPSPAVWEALAVCPKLKELQLDVQTVKTAEASIPEGMQGVEGRDNAPTRQISYTVTSQSSSLQKLVVDGDIDEQTLSSLIGAHCSTLITVQYHTSRARCKTPADAVMKALAQCAKLKELTITKWSTCCEHIIALPCLKKLRVDVIPDKTIPPFPTLLEELQVAKFKGKLNSELVAALSSLPRLRVLDLPVGNSVVKGIAELKQIIPRLVVRRTGH